MQYEKKLTGISCRILCFCSSMCDNFCFMCDSTTIIKDNEDTIFCQFDFKFTDRHYFN